MARRGLSRRRGHRRVDSKGVGCESRQAIGLVTFAGMLVATIVGIAFPPTYFAMFSHKGQKKQEG